MKLIMILCVFISGCSVASIRRFDTRHDNYIAAQKISRTFRIDELVFDKKADQKKNPLKREYLWCRGARVDLPSEQSVEMYLTSSLKKELSDAGKIDENSPSLILKINKIEVYTTDEPSHWDIDIDYIFEDHIFNIKNSYQFQFAIFGNVACSNAANNLNDAISENRILFYRQLLSLK